MNKGTTKFKKPISIFPCPPSINYELDIGNDLKKSAVANVVYSG
jgi:hypothetical protein